MFYRLILAGKADSELLKKIKNDDAGKVDGISELYDELICCNYCESYSNSGIHYVALILLENNIKFIFLRE